MRTTLPLLLGLSALIMATSSCTKRTTQRHIPPSEIGDCPGGSYDGDVKLRRPNDPTMQRFIKSGCTRIRGDLAIFNYTAQPWPAVLKKLTRVDGTVAIIQTELTHVRFPALKRVGDTHGSLIIAHNKNLAFIHAFPALTNVAGTIEIRDNATLSSLGDFPSLTSITGGITIQKNPRLASIPPFSALERAGQHASVIQDNGRLPQCRVDVLAQAMHKRGVSITIESSGNKHDPKACH